MPSQDSSNVNSGISFARTVPCAFFLVSSPSGNSTMTGSITVNSNNEKKQKSGSGSFQNEQNKLNSTIAFVRFDCHIHHH
jgi:hypothetical protein